MEKRSLTVFRLAHIFIVIVLGYIILRQGAFFLIPLILAALLTIMLQPLNRFFLRLVKRIVPAVLLTIFTVIIVLGIVITLLSVQLSAIIANLDNITGNISQGLNDVFDWLDTHFDFQESDLKENIPNLANNAVGFVQKGISSVTTFLFNLFFVLLLIFFMLWYQHNFKQFLLMETAPQKRAKLEEIVQKVQETMRKYLYGLLTVMAILAVLNSIGLLIIGIKYAVFWGVLAALLSIIPYIGTTLGGTLPFLYAVATAGNWWQPLTIVALYAFIQQIEGNIITPKVVGSSVSINPMVALLAIILGGFIWGIAGIILAIPITGVVKILLDHNPGTRSFGFLLGNQMSSKDGIADDELWE